MNANEFVANALSKGILPLRREKAPFSTGSVSEPNHSAHGFRIPVVMASCDAVFQYTPEGTNDGLRDGASEVKIAGPTRVYFDKAALVAAGLWG